MQKIIILILLVISGQTVQAQKSLFKEIQSSGISDTSAREANVYNQYKKNPMVKRISFIRVDLSVLKDDKIQMQIGDKILTAVRKRDDQYEAGEDISWFGRLEDETGIFFTRMNGQIASKFYMGIEPCLIVPYKKDIHLLVIYSNEIDNGICGMANGTPQSIQTQGSIKTDITRAVQSPDDICTMRVLWVVTAQAEPEITMPLEMAARMLQDESNLAYQQSFINYRMEIARVIRTSYSETVNFTNSVAYGVPSQYPSDLINLSNGTGMLTPIPFFRNLYNADVVVMVRSRAVNAAQGFYGVAYGVPTDPATLNPVNAFALISTEYMIGGRFTFAHEIGHIQGARHDNHPSNPAYGRGYIFNASGITNRTIMAVGGSCNPSTGCRVQFFSTPLVTFGGTPVGIANSRDNARRINETGIQIKAHRITSTNLLLSSETFDAEILARHLATQTISTNNNVVVALTGSRVSMRAGNSVTLLPGFAANNGCVFSAYINNCNYVPVLD